MAAVYTGTCALELTLPCCCHWSCCSAAAAAAAVTLLTVKQKEIIRTLALDGAPATSKGGKKQR
jgi:hypothetical protein